MTPISRSSWTETITINGATVGVHRLQFRQLRATSTPSELPSSPGATLINTTRRSPLLSPLVNETFARKFFPNENPIGKTYKWPVLTEPVEIVGVVKDARYYNLREPVPPTSLSRRKPGKTRACFATIEIRSNTNLIPAIKSAMAEVNRDVTLNFTSFSTQVDESLVRERLLATLSGFFGALALLLATIGLYGVMSYNVARRRNEIGIRMALGAEQSRVLRMVLGEVCLLIFIGLGAGFAATLATTRYVSSFLYGLTPNDPWTLGSAAALLAMVAMFAGYLPARRASRLDPMTALREE